MPCVGVREGVGEASVAVRMGRLLSIESSLIGSAEAVVAVEGNTGWTAKVRDGRAPRCQRTHARTYIWCRDLGGLGLSPARAGASWESEKAVTHEGKEQAIRIHRIVVMKRANKEGELSAESVERRDGAKRNSAHQSTDRTQSRMTVTQAGVGYGGRRDLPSLPEVGADVP